MAINSIKLNGNWKEGYALDKHTKSSEYIGEDVFGHKQFKNTYTEIGELLYINDIYVLAITKTG